MASGTVTPAQVYQQVISQGGSSTQAQVAAALVDGIESGGQLNDQNPTSTASGLFQFLDTTWDNYGGVGHAGNATFQQQVAKFISESGGPGGDNFYAWAPDLGGSYNGSGTWTQIGGKVGQTIQQNSAAWGAAAPATNMSQSDWQALYAAGQQGGTAYLEAANAAAQSGGSSASAAQPASPTTTAPAQSVVIGGQTYETPAGDPNASSQISALGQMSATLASYGFSGGDLQTLTQWAWTEMTGNVDPSQVVLDLQTPGSAVYPIFDKQFPGFVAANQKLTSQGLQAVSVQQYQQYQTYATQTAQAMGLPPGFINSQDIGTLIGNNVSQTELSARLNDAMVLAYQSTPEQQTEFNQYFGTTTTGPGAVHGPLTLQQIAALSLDPTKAEPLINQQIHAAQIGGASVTSGVGAIDAATATELAKAGITTAAATSAFQNLAPLAALETPRPGMGGEAAQGIVSPEQLAVGNLLGNPAAQRQEQTAVEVAKAPFAGGGGYVATSKGAGVGSANPNGTGNA
jgi:hypothetical protein